MFCAVDYILEGLADNLELERELGNFAVDFDREFLAKLPKERTCSRVARDTMSSCSRVARDTMAEANQGDAKHCTSSDSRGFSHCTASDSRARVAPATTQPTCDYCFLHHAAVAGPGVEMMANVIKAMKTTPENAPIVFTGEKPKAKIYIVLGEKALAQWYDGVSLAYGGWFKDVDSEVLLTYSPEFIYRFGVNLSAAMVAKKREMWVSLQEAMAKVGVKR